MNSEPVSHWDKIPLDYMHALFPVSLLFVWRQLEFSVGMADSATNDESYIKMITQIQNLNLLAIALKKCRS